MYFRHIGVRLKEKIFNGRGVTLIHSKQIIVQPVEYLVLWDHLGHFQGMSA